MNMKSIVKVLLTALVLPVAAYAQHDHNGHNMPANKQEQKTGSPDTTKKKEQHTGHSDDKNMSHAYSLSLPMNRNGSGTAWLPDNSPMYGKMLHSRKWMYMLHGNLF